MRASHQIYNYPFGLLTDLYELTMAYGYWKSGLDDMEAVFHLFFRENPFDGGFAVACGIETAVELIERYRFGGDDLEYLGGLRGADDRPLFTPDFLDYLSELKIDCEIAAVPEGTVVFPHQPLLRVQGPIVHSQLIESALLNIVNFQTLIATKSARVCQAARGQPVLEFGLRRAQGIDGALSASRAAYIGGCAATSNVLAGKIFGIPVKGTHAHSWVMLFHDELEAFRTYAHAMPNNCVFLVDTYDTLQGVNHAIHVGLELRRLGHEMVGIRLDSGDLAELSIAARKLLDEAGFPHASIVASNELDEHAIDDLTRQGAKIGIWGVGTRLATAYDQPALGGVYKLAAVRRPGAAWEYKVKRSEQRIKTSIPGILQIRRFENDTGFVGDCIFDDQQGFSDSAQWVDLQSLATLPIPHYTQYEDLLQPVYRAGQRVRHFPDTSLIRQRVRQQLSKLSHKITRFAKPERYPVALHEGVHHNRETLLDEISDRLEAR